MHHRASKIKVDFWGSTPTPAHFKLVSHCPEVDPRWTHKYVPSAAPSENCWHAKDFVMSPDVDPDAGET